MKSSNDEVELASRRQMKRKPTDYLRHIYYGSITYDVRWLKYLIEIVGPEHVMFGTDWPHWVHDTKGAFANTAQLPEGQMKAVREGNAVKVFGFWLLARHLESNTGRPASGLRA
jgi:aminocarboxymuconate-semialdehyde decarboxylase